MAWTLRDMPDQSGRVAVVTGANGGLGLETTRALAAHGAHVVMAARNLDKAELAERDVRSTVADPSLEVVPLDLASLRSVRQAADTILEQHERLDLLINNAGIMAVPERRTEDGFEHQLGVNHLGHWALTAHLLPALLRADAPRVVSVTSTAHHFGRPVHPDDPHLERGYGPWKAYGQSKLANLHFALGLQRALEHADAPAASLVAHPGLTDTDLQSTSVREHGGFLARLLHHVTAATGMSPRAGALSQLRAATDPAARGGQFYGPRWMNSGPPVRKPILRRIGLGAAIRTLWQVSERETGVVLDVEAALRDARG